MNVHPQTHMLRRCLTHPTHYPQPGALRSEYLDNITNSLHRFGEVNLGPTSTVDVLYVLVALAADGSRGRKTASNDGDFVSSAMTSLMESIDSVKLNGLPTDQQRLLEIMLALSQRLIDEVIVTVWIYTDQLVWNESAESESESE